MKARPSRRLLAAATAGVALAALLAGAPAHAAAPFDHIANDTVWKDTTGNPIKAQGGNVFREGSTWYWVGTAMEPSPDPANPLAKSINLYSSADLENWKFEKALVTQSGTTGDLAKGAWLGRPQLIHRPATSTDPGEYIIWAEVGSGLKNSNGDPLGNAQGVFTSPTINGTYTYRGKQLVHRKNADGTYTDVSSGDRSVFVEGGAAYLVYVGDSTSTRNVDINVAPLSADWREVGNPIYTGSLAHHEAPGIVKVGTTYYLFASNQDWWNGTPTSYLTGTTLTNFGAWKDVINAPANTGSSFQTQFESVIPVTGSTGTSYLYNGDRYSQFYTSGSSTAPGGIGRNAWYPLTFDAAGVPTLNGATDVDVDAAAGTLDWNYVANGRFDQTVPGGTIPQWSYYGTAGAVRVEATGSTATNQQLVLAGTDFTASAYQDVSLPNGTYTVSFDYKSKQYPASAAVTVTNNATSPADAVAPADLTASQSTFLTRTLTVKVTTGTLRITASVNSTSSARLELDNISVWKQ